ncbi:MAG: membrane fusion protein of tripartite multidrug resistance system, partial [Methylobacter sp.]
MNLTAKIDMLNQRIAVKKAALIQVRHDLQRFVMAARDGAVSEQQVQNAQDKARELEAAIGETRAELVGVKAEVLGTPIPNHPVVEKAKSQVRQAYLNFYRRNIVAPVSGYIAKRQVQ